MFQLLGFSAVAGAAILAFTMSLPADATETRSVLRNAETGLCLDSAGGRVYPRDCGLGDAPIWTLNDGITLARPAGLCLESDAGKRVYTDVCAVGNSYQKWARGSGNTLRNLATGFCLDSHALTSQCDGGRSQQWKQS